MWLFTVVSLTTSWAAISALERPWAISERTSASRGGEAVGEAVVFRGVLVAGGDGVEQVVLDCRVDRRLAVHHLA